MFGLLSFKESWWVKGIAIAAITSIGLQSLPSWAAFNPGGTVGKPGNRRGLATRGGECKASGTPTLTTLVPKNNVGLSASATPTFYWFVPKNTYQYVNFALYKVDAQDNPTETLYSTLMQISGQSGLANLTLPNQPSIQPLQAGVSYRWIIKLRCSLQDRRGLAAMGWVTYRPPSSALANQLAIASPANKHNLYAEAGYWYDAVTELAAQKQAKPRDPKVQQAWQALMGSEYVQLNEIAAQ
ncbi:MAG: DUF928 domain-containing protein [Acaryochloris sp. RU_4_1]|nr:DUF928 domain-containing protein [Acaryochloris sp. RU_4_1]NJN38896.1 DUF928 domain-containing protein [Acaryochloridaceae cyanobacterium CSU_3_4]NJR53675.1 DUF928 domain-containing protein [Acaryochloris sp. CRU_2_0]